MFGYILMTAQLADSGLLENGVLKQVHQRHMERQAYKQLFSLATVI